MRRARPLPAALVAAALVLAGCSGDAGGGSGGAEAERRDLALAAATDFLDGWAALDPGAAAAATDEPAAAEEMLTEVLDTLRVQAADIEAGEPAPGAPAAAASRNLAAGDSPDGDDPAADDPDGDDPAADGSAVTVPFRATLTLATLGDWAYDGRVVVREGEPGWTVDAVPDAIHPELTDGTRLARSRTLLPRAAVLDGRGRELMAERPVREVGIEPRRMTDPAAAYAVATELGVDAEALRQRVEVAPADQLVPVIVLREDDYAGVAGAVAAADGYVVTAGTRTLAPTATFARAVLGTVRPATVETLADAGPLASEGDEVGAAGLQRAFEVRLAGTPAGAVRLVDRATGGVAATLHEFPGEPGTPLRTSLDLDVQAAAEAVLADAGTAGAVVAVRPSTGEVLAAASAPAADGLERALAGRYPPGSTFKVVTTAALLDGGLTPDDVVPCPAEATVEGRVFTNAGGFVLGDVPFRTDFAKSCNTAFVAASGDLAPDALHRAAAPFGLGQDRDLGVPAYSGEVPVAEAPVDRAAAAIGQGRVLASPLAMAVVAATVQSGELRAPVLLPETASGAPPAPLDPGTARVLQALMREVVTDGSATVLDIPGEPVAAKTGTAEYGTEVPPRTHAWIIGYRGDLAFAVLLEDGGSGGRDAGPVARAFLESLGG